MNTSNIELNMTYNLILPYNSIFLRKLAEEVAVVAKLNFEWRYWTLVIFLHTRSLGISEFIKAYGKTVVIQEEPTLWLGLHNVSQVVVYGKNIREIDIILNFLSRTVKNTGRFIIVCIDQLCDEKRVMQLCWKHKITNMVFIKPDEDFGEFITLTYYPFSSDNCCEDTRPVLLNRTDCDDSCIERFYPEKLKNLHTCQITASVFHQPPMMYVHTDNGTDITSVSGSDGELLVLLTTMLNASLKIVIPTDEFEGGRQLGERWTGSLGDLQTGRANISMTSAALTYTRYLHFEISRTYSAMFLVWITCPPALKPSWEKIFYPYKPKIRALLFGTFTIIVFVNYFFRTKFSKKIIKLLKLSSIRENLLYRSWQIFMAMPIKFKPTSFSIAISFLVWTSFSFWMRVSYTAVLMSTLNADRYEARFDSFEDAALNAHIPFGGRASLRQYYIEDKFVYDGWTNSGSNVSKILDELSNCTSKYLVAVNDQSVFDFIKYSHARRMIQVIPRAIVNSPVVIFFKKFSPLSEPINDLLSKLTEAGLFERINHKYDPRGDVIKMRNTWMKSEKYGKVIPLKFHHFIGCWVLILSGWVIALICFLVELCVFLLFK